MKRLSMELKGGQIMEISLSQGDENFLIMSVQSKDSLMEAYLSQQEAEWFLKLLDMHIQERGYDD